jgi:hypothetical protein
MGEAKRRRETESTYGVVAKDLQTKGLVISNPIWINQNGSTLSGGLDPLELRFSLLYWDKLVWPKSNLINFPGGYDAEYLETLKI